MTAARPREAYMDALARMDQQAWGRYKTDLEKQDRRARRAERDAARHASRSYTSFERDDPGHPLGKGMPTGAGFRRDGETHRQAWMRVVRMDPCSYCGAPPGMTLEDTGVLRLSLTTDHIEPQNGPPARGIGGAHSWLNYTSACESCNGRKSNHSLLDALYRRRWGTGIQPRTHGEIRRARATAAVRSGAR